MPVDYEKALTWVNGLKDFNAHNGIKLTKLEDDYAECRVELTPASMNGQNIAHGGLIHAMADVVAGLSLMKLDRPCVTATTSLSYLRPARGSYLRAVGTPVKVGSSIHTAEARVYDSEDRLVAQGLFTYCYAKHTQS